MGEVAAEVSIKGTLTEPLQQQETSSSQNTATVIRSNSEGGTIVLDAASWSDCFCASAPQEESWRTRNYR